MIVQQNEHTQLLIPEHFESYTFAPFGNHRILELGGPDCPEEERWAALDGLPLLLIAHIEPITPMCHMFEKWLVPMIPHEGYEVDLRDTIWSVNNRETVLGKLVQEMVDRTWWCIEHEGYEVPIPEIKGLDPRNCFILQDSHIEPREADHG